MAIRDLTWACFRCGASSGLESLRRGERCRSCGAVHRRGSGAEITVVGTDGESETRHAGRWLADVPPPDPDRTTFGPEPVIARFTVGQTPIRRGGELVGWVEQFGPRTTAALHLDEMKLVLDLDGRPPVTWPLEHITAVQPSSTALQIKAREAPVASLRFPDSSVRLWEHRLQTAIRRRYHVLGRGDILDFQPRIVTAS